MSLTRFASIGAQICCLFAMFSHVHAETWNLVEIEKGGLRNQRWLDVDSFSISGTSIRYRVRGWSSYYDKAYHATEALVVTEGGGDCLNETMSAELQLACQIANLPPALSATDAKRASNLLSAAKRQEAKAIFKAAFELFRESDFKAALIQFRKGLDIDPADHVGRYYLGELYVRLDQAAKAKSQFDLVVALAPNSKEAAKAQARLEAIEQLANRR